MITKDSIETAYSFLHQKRNVYIHSTLDWQKDDIEYAIGSYVDDMSQELYESISDGKIDFLRDHKWFEDDITRAVEKMDFKGYDAVFFIAGITSIGTPKDVYVRISQEIPLHFADIMPDKERMTFIYLSGAGTSPDGKQIWQQVKSKTEAEIQTKGFKRTFGFRPAIMRWAKGQKHVQKMQYAFIVFYPLMRLLGQANNMKEIALSQLVLTRDGYHKFAIETKDIAKLAKKF